MHATLADIVADTAQNSIEAGASRVDVSVIEDGNLIKVRVSDNGKGMDAPTVRRAFDPFYTEPGKHDRRRVGLGLPLLKQSCEACGGSVSLKSRRGVGTELSYSFDPSNIDMPPIGNLADSVVTLFNYPGDFDLSFAHRTASGGYSISRNELADAVGDLDTVEGLTLAREYMRSQEDALRFSAQPK